MELQDEIGPARLLGAAARDALGLQDADAVEATTARQRAVDAGQIARGAMPVGARNLRAPPSGVVRPEGQ